LVCEIVVSFPLRYAVHHYIVIVLKRFSDFLPVPIRNFNNKTKEATMATIASISHSERGICAKCGFTLFAPDWSEYMSERLVLNLWSCVKCGHRFETEAHMPADAESIEATETMKAFFPSLLVA
jgi:ribosomal protein L37AE/L43A